MILSILIAVPILFYILIPIRKPFRYVLAGVLIGYLYLLFWPSTYKNYRLEKEGQHTTGILLSKSCEVKTSQKISYKFQADGNDFKGSGRPGAGNQSCERFQVGDQVFITYLGNDPKINTPSREVNSDIFIGILFSIGIFLCLVWSNGIQARFIAVKRRKREENE